VTWLASASYVAAAWLMLLGLFTRIDRRVIERAGARTRERRALAARLGRHVRSGAVRTRLRLRLDAAGHPTGDIDAFLGRKVCGALAGGLLGASALPRGGLLAVFSGAALALAGFQLPDFLLARRVHAVRSAISKSVPDLLDLVAVSVSAGLSARLALERAPEAITGPLREEMARIRREVSLGGSWRSGLRSAALRTGIGELRRLAITLERSERLGAPVAERLRRLSREVRAERRLEREERARRAPVAMLFPLVFLILPAFVLSAVVPALLVATRGIP
jgi:tight adherence protein C